MRSDVLPGSRPLEVNMDLAEKWLVSPNYPSLYRFYNSTQVWSKGIHLYPEVVGLLRILRQELNQNMNKYLFA
jgi:hypothetical protein